MKKRIAIVVVSAAALAVPTVALARQYSDDSVRHGRGQDDVAVQIGQRATDARRGEVEARDGADDPVAHEAEPELRNGADDAAGDDRVAPQPAATAPADDNGVDATADDRGRHGGDDGSGHH
jgi:hypothetical protein